MSGTNFGLNDSLVYTEFEFDSFDCVQSYNQAYFTTDWPNFLMGKPLSNVAAIKIIEVQIPFTYYVFNSTNNTFTLNESLNSQSRTITIPVGNYSSTTIIPALNAAMSTLAGPNKFIYTTTFSSTTQLLTITATTGTGAAYSGTFSMIFGSGLSDPGNTNPRLWLGFSGGTNTSTTGGVLVSPSVIQLTGPNYCYLNSRTFGQLVQLYIPGNGLLNPVNTGSDGTQISRIPITSQPGGVTFWQDPVPMMWFDVGNTSFTGPMDFFCTLGTNPAPMQFNGGSFVIKMGILTNNESHNDYLGGGKQNNRAVKRAKPMEH